MVKAVNEDSAAVLVQEGEAEEGGTFFDLDCPLISPPEGVENQCQVAPASACNPNQLLDLGELEYIEKFLDNLTPFSMAACDGKLYREKIRAERAERAELDEQVSKVAGGHRPRSSRESTRLQHGPRSMLGDVEKRSRHIASEHKRRNQIKEELERMSELVPTITKCKTRNSQAKILAHGTI